MSAAAPPCVESRAADFLLCSMLLRVFHTLNWHIEGLTPNKSYDCEFIDGHLSKCAPGGSPLVVLVNQKKFGMSMTRNDGTVVSNWSSAASEWYKYENVEGATTLFSVGVSVPVDSALLRKLWPPGTTREKALNRLNTKNVTVSAVIHSDDGDVTIKAKVKDMWRFDHSTMNLLAEVLLPVGVKNNADQVQPDSKISGATSESKPITEKKMAFVAASNAAKLALLNKRISEAKKSVERQRAQLRPLAHAGSCSPVSDEASVEKAAAALVSMASASAHTGPCSAVNEKTPVEKAPAALVPPASDSASTAMSHVMSMVKNILVDNSNACSAPKP